VTSSLLLLRKTSPN